jgi:hypothetical protein
MNQRGKARVLTYDPYGWAMARIVPTIANALHHGGAMSDGEAAILTQLREVIRKNDPESLKLTAVGIRVILRNEAEEA